MLWSSCGALRSILMEVDLFLKYICSKLSGLSKFQAVLTAVRCGLYLIGKESSSYYKSNTFILYLVHIYQNSVRF